MIQPPPGSFTLPRALPRAIDDGASRPVRFLIWGATASVTLGLHVGLYLLLTRMGEAPPVPPPQMPAAVMINLSPIAVSAKSEVDNASDTPPAAESQAVEKVEEEEPPPPPAPELVPDAPLPPPNVVSEAVLAPKPPVVVKKAEKPPEKPVKKPVEKKDKPKKPTKPQEKPQVASKSGGGPKSDRQTADVTAASSAGSAVSEASRASWQNEVRSKIVRAKRFPSDARGQSGVAVVSVTFGANGGASGARLVRSSGNASLDAEAVAVMYRAAPYPIPPGGKTTVLMVPLNFRQ
ncbi:TonB family protein [Methylobacterium sp. 77]|uniref:TonB family protein n=1 Tax=Methylobacterium sp. 77 TaxID=1101192 RepID=UPI000374C04D|nr:TonB family protein [Methylobacterium sp. 77]